MRRMRSAPEAYCRGIFGVLCLFSLFSIGMRSAYGQQSVTSAVLSGQVEDANGAAISGATITAINLDQNQTSTTMSDSHGRYRFLYLPVGHYQLKLEASGFATISRDLTLTIGQSLDVPLKLAVAGMTANVDVTSEAPLVETVRTQVTDTILPREILNLPLNGRNYLDLALLTPAVSRTNTGSNQRFAETSAVPGTGISVAGQRNLNNSFIVDGLSANDDAADLAGTFYSQDVIREFQVITSGGIAEFGRASSGVVNIISHSGTNDWRGRLYGFLRNQRLDARNPLAPTKDPLTQAQYGASIGGPVKRDRTFFFTNFEQTRLNNSVVLTIRPEDVTVINNTLNSVNYHGPRISTGLAPTGLDSTNFFARADHRLNAANLLTARYSLYDISSLNARTVGGLNDISRGTSLENRDQTVAISDFATLSPHTINEARFQYTRSRLSAPPNDLTGPGVNISGVANFGTATFSPTARAIDLYEIVDNVTTQRDGHSLKFGVDILVNRVDILFPGAVQGVYTFSSLANLQAGRYVTFQQAFGAPNQFQANPNFGWFMQDEWRPRADLTINAGLRYDLQLLPAPIKLDGGNVAPRLGIAYAPGDRKTVIRASYGLYYERIPLRATSNALQRDGSKYKVAVLSFGQTGAPAFPNTLSAFPDGLLASITTIDPEVENAYSQQANLQIERELTPTTSLSAGYLHLRGLHLILSRNVNVPRFPASAGVPNQGRPDPRFANISRFESSGNSNYNGLTVSLNRRFRSWLGARVSYTFSKSIDNAGNFFFFTPQDNNNLRGERGLSDNDQRHRLAVSGALEATPSTSDRWYRRAINGFQLSYIFSYASPYPFNVQAGADLNNDTNVNDRPPGVGRNTGKGFDYASLDLRLSRRFRITEAWMLEVIAEGFNLFNRANLQLPNNVFGTGSTSRPGFGQPTAASDPRQIQFGLRLSF
jgi:Carboxypeptidase regulatory-like domain